MDVSKSRFPAVIVLFFSCAIIMVSNRGLSARENEFIRPDDATSETLYLPSGKGLTFMSFGYRNALSGLLWLDTVSYFGKHYASDKRYEWLAHRCKLVTSLNPRVYDPYYFCSTMLAWEANQPKLAVAVLTDAISVHSDDWFFPYLRGFYELHFLKDGVSAQQDFLASSKKPGANPIAARLAAKELSDLESPATAVAFLKGMIQNSHDDLERSMLTDKLSTLLRAQGEGRSAAP